MIATSLANYFFTIIAIFIAIIKLFLVQHDELSILVLLPISWEKGFKEPRIRGFEGGRER